LRERERPYISNHSTITALKMGWMELALVTHTHTHTHTVTAHQTPPADVIYSRD